MNTNISRCSKHLHFLKKLALCLAISLCTSSSILHSMEQKEFSIIEQEQDIIQTIQNINLEQDWNRFKRLRTNEKYEQLWILDSETDSIIEKEGYSEQAVESIIKTAECYAQNHSVRHEFWQIWIDCLKKRNNLFDMKEQYKNNSSIVTAINNKLEAIAELKGKASDVWLSEYVILRTRLKKLATKINNEDTNINPDLIKEMNTAIDNMYKE